MDKLDDITKKQQLHAPYGQNKIPNKCSSIVQMERESKDIRTTTEKYKATVSKDVK